MMQTGIFTGYFPYSLEETAKKIRALNFNTVQLDMHFKDVDVSAGQITKEKCTTIRDTFRDHNLPICCVSGYTNIIHPDKEERARRPVSRFALRDLRDRYVQHGVGLGSSPEEQDRRRF
jgi:sugar phosphate isomerase/epimerase